MKSFLKNNELPTVAALQDVLKSVSSYSFSFITLSQNYYAQLVDSLPHHAVNVDEYAQTISIYPSISSEKILNRKTEILACAQSFRLAANNLMSMIGDNFDVDLQTLDGLYHLRFIEGIRVKSRKLNDEWIFSLHGAECRFENIITGQKLAVIIITFPEFGYLNAYFFHLFMSTTAIFKPLNNYLENNLTNVSKALDLLVLEGMLTEKEMPLGSKRKIAL
ncbi:DUF6896 domain-containing protein [Chitinophaga rhizosphaerae]|uniref:DUF6896 domain-containing protein n=1 Tax=Chitinophaga rhizosphaerae TaxID=1864947 RepID=UPI000F806914|nr:hypothetical protein [Chitinophaga rhizosphaerae]